MMSMMMAVITPPLSELFVLDSVAAAADCEAALFKTVGAGEAMITRVDGTVIVSILEESLAVL